MPNEISTKGLEGFNQKFLAGRPDEEGETQVMIHKGQDSRAKAVEAYEKQRKEEFIQRAAGFTEDLVAFVVDQKSKRGLSDSESVFGLALANINLRYAYGAPQSPEEKEKGLTKERKKELLNEFDDLCYTAQQYWDENT